MTAYRDDLFAIKWFPLLYFPDLNVHEAPANTIQKNSKRRPESLLLLKVNVYSDFTGNCVLYQNFFLQNHLKFVSLKLA
jgi:hypothetical protein